MTEKLQITLDEEATKKYLAWASKRLEAEVEADMEPCGCTIMVEISGVYGSTAYDGGGELEFGDADVDLI